MLRRARGERKTGKRFVYGRTKERCKCRGQWHRWLFISMFSTHSASLHHWLFTQHIIRYYPFSVLMLLHVLCSISFCISVYFSILSTNPFCSIIFNKYQIFIHSTFLYPSNLILRQTVHDFFYSFIIFLSFWIKYFLPFSLFFAFILSWGRYLNHIFHLDFY